MRFIHSVLHRIVRADGRQTAIRGLASVTGLLAVLTATDALAQQDLQRAANAPQAGLSAKAIAEASSELIELGNVVARRQRDLEAIDKEIERIEAFIAEYQPCTEIEWIESNDSGGDGGDDGGDDGGGGGDGGC